MLRFVYLMLRFVVRARTVHKKAQRFSADQHSQPLAAIQYRIACVLYHGAHRQPIDHRVECVAGTYATPIGLLKRQEIGHTLAGIPNTTVRVLESIPPSSDSSFQVYKLSALPLCVCMCVCMCVWSR